MMAGWIGVILILVGNVRLATRHWNAFLIIIAGNICWLISGISTTRYDMVALALTSIVIHARNYIHWKYKC